MKKLLIAIGAFAMMYWAYKAGERTAIRACMEDESETKREGDGSDPDTPESGADEEMPEPSEGVETEDETANFIGMNTNF